MENRDKILEANTQRKNQGNSMEFRALRRLKTMTLPTT